jgi:thioredoxin-related protein
MIVMAASVLAACGASPAASTSKAPAVVPVTQPAAGAAQAGASGAPAGTDIYSPTQTVNVGDKLSTDAAVVPASVLANVAARKPMLIFWSDPTTKVTADQLKEINSALKKYQGAIQLVSIDYTVGLTSSATTASIDPATQKIELFAASLNVTTTPFIVFVDQYGRITYKFAGIVDSGLLTREVLRATQ